MVLANVSDWIDFSIAGIKRWGIVSATEYISQYLSCTKYLQHLHISTMFFTLTSCYLILCYLIIFYLNHIYPIIIDYI
jgi:hypothetical protein